MKLKNLLTISFIAISAIPLFVGLQYLNLHSGNYSRAQFVDHLSSLSLIAKKRILTAVDRIQDNTALVASRTQLRVSLANWNETAEAADRDRIVRIIGDAKQSLPHLQQVSVYDRQGRFLASTSPVSGEDRLRAEDLTRPTISLVPDDGEILAVGTSPLFLDGETVGYIRLVFFGDFISDLVRDRTGLGDTGEWLIALRHESGDAMFAVPLKYDHLAAFKLRIPRNRVDVPITQALLGNETIMSNAPDYRGRPVLASTRYIAPLDWGLVAKMDETEINALITENNRIIYIAEFALILVAIVIGVLMSYFVSHPIETLQRHAVTVAEGNLEDPPRIRGWKEVSDLSRHFGVMIAKLRDMNENLQQKIDASTRELEVANELLEELASLDPLTTLMNRRSFEIRLREEFSRARRYEHDLAVVMLDVDHFKSVNDTHGHAAGDEVLKAVGRYLKSAIRDSDIVARVGGEEFSVVLPECASGVSMAFLERIRLDIAEIVFSAGSENFNVTCSFGVAYLEKHHKTYSALLDDADKALYQAKESGRNRIVLYQESRKVTHISSQQAPKS